MKGSLKRGMLTVSHRGLCIPTRAISDSAIFVPANMYTRHSVFSLRVRLSLTLQPSVSTEPFFLDMFEWSAITNKDQQ